MVKNTLLAIIAILLVALVFLQANQMSTQTPYTNANTYSDAVGYAINHPTLKAEQQSLYNAPALTEFNRGIHTWN